MWTALFVAIFGGAAAGYISSAVHRAVVIKPAQLKINHQQTALSDKLDTVLNAAGAEAANAVDAKLATVVAPTTPDGVIQ